MANVSKLLVFEVHGRTARVQVLNGLEEDWPLASLPRGVEVADLVRITEHAGDVQVEIERAVPAHLA